jgi:hypothetical protein
MASNAALLTRLATLARQAEDHAIISAADRLIYLSFQVRMNALVAEFCLFLRWTFPSWIMSVPMSLERYQRLLEDCHGVLSRNQQPPERIQMAGQRQDSLGANTLVPPGISSLFSASG